MSSSPWDRPPTGIAVADFFRDWLPQAFRASGRTAPDSAPLVRASISGDAAGPSTWDLQAGGDELTVTALPPGPGAPTPSASTPSASTPSASTPDVWLRQTAADLLAALSPVPDPDLPELLPPGWSVLDLLFLDPRDIELLRQVSGRVLVEVAGRRRRRWAFDVGFGPAGVSAGRPRSTIRLDGATFDGLRNGSVPPMQPLLDVRLQLEGDRA